MTKQETSQVRIEMEGELQRRFEILKKYFGLENNTEVVRVLINDKFKQLFPKERLADDVQNFSKTTRSVHVE
jgi:hypothetical protein